MRVLGIDLGDGVARIAHGEQSSFGGARVERVDTVTFDDADALAAVLRRHAGARVHLAVPLQATTHRVLRLPFRDGAQLRRTAPLELLGQLPIDPAAVDVATLVLGPCDGGTDVLAVAARRDVLDACRTPAPSARLTVGALAAASLLPHDAGDVVLLLADGRRSALVRRRDGRLVALRALGADARDGDALRTEVGWTLPAWGGTPRILVAGPDAHGVAALGTVLDEPDTAVARGLVVAGARDRLVLGGPDTATEAGSWRRAAVLAAAAVALAVVDVLLVRIDLGAREAALARETQAVAAAALPDVAPERARLVLEETVAARRRQRPAGDTPVLDVLREVSTRIPAALRLDLDELAVEPDAIVLHGRCDGFDAADALRRALAASPMLGDVRLEETRTTVDGRGVELRLRAARRTTMGAPS